MHDAIITSTDSFSLHISGQNTNLFLQQCNAPPPPAFNTPTYWLTDPHILPSFRLLGGVLASDLAPNFSSKAIIYARYARVAIHVNEFC